MNGIWRVLSLSCVLGASSFIIGVLPLSFTFSGKSRLQLSTFGNGLLLGAALGVIIPEGIEAVPSTEGNIPTSQIALSLVVGFVFMLLVEQYLAPHTTPTMAPSNIRTVFQLSSLTQEATEYDLDTTDVENTTMSPMPTMEITGCSSSGRSVIAYPLTLGLVIHSLADGLALGASAAGEHTSDTSLSLVVFFALIIHKSPTALALTSSLLSTSLPRSEIRKHVAIFSAATPFGALTSFALLSFISAHAGNWTGIALLISGGTFLYVATVIQPIGAHSHEREDSLPTEELSKHQRVSLLLGGIFLPFLVGSLIGHGHQKQ